MDKQKRVYKALLVLLCGLAGGSIGICSNTVGVFYTPVSEDLGVLRGTFAMHSTLSIMATGLTALLLPRSMQKYAYKRILTTGVLLAVLATGAMAFARNMPLFYILGIVRGIGAGAFAAVPITMIINNWFKKKHGVVTSIVFSFSGLVGAVCTPVLTRCIETMGWQAGYIVQGGMLLLLSLPALVCRYTLQPEDMKLVPYGYDGKESKPVAVTKSKTKFHYLNVGFLCFVVLAFIHMMISGIGQHMTGLAQNLGYSVELGAAMVSMAMLGNIGSKLIIGTLSDAITPPWACVVMMSINIAALLMILLGTSPALLLAASFFYGTVYSIGAVGLPLLTKYFFGLENYAAVFSVIGLVTNVGQSLALTLVGYVYDFTGSYRYALLGAVSIHIINFILLLIVKSSTQKHRIQ